MSDDIFGTEVNTDIGGAPYTVQAPVSDAKRQYEAKLMTLSDSDRRQVEMIRRSIVPGDFKSIQDYAKTTIAANEKIVTDILHAANSTALDELGGGINQILASAREIDASQLVSAKSANNPIARIFPWFFNTKEKIVAKFNNMGEQIEKYSSEIQKTMKTTEGSIQMLENMGKSAINQYKQFEVHILTGKAAADEMRTDYVRELAEAKANPNTDALVLQELSKKEQFIDTLEKKISNLEQMQQVAYLQIPQLALMVKNCVDNRNEFQQILDMTIPMWKQQFATALQQDQQSRASNLIKSSKDFTNDMLRKSADSLRTTSLQIAENGARGLIDRATLEHVQTNLIQTIQGTLAIHNKAKEERNQIAQSIQTLRVDFKNSLQQ